MTFRTLTFNGSRRVDPDAGTKAAANKHVQKLVDDAVAAAIQKNKVQTVLEPSAGNWKTVSLVAEEDIGAGRFIRMSARGMKIANATHEVMGICVAAVKAGESGRVVMEGSVEMSSWDVAIPVGGHVGCGPGGWLKAAATGEPALGKVSSDRPSMTFDFQVCR